MGTMTKAGSGLLPVGHRLDGRYEVVRFLGAGGMGVVYAARPIHADHEVAVKVMRAPATQDGALARRFLEEAQLSLRVRHPNVVVVYDFGRTAEGLVYLAMELLDGTTLREELADGPLPLVQALSIATQICAGLSAVHRGTIVHRDLKPENVMLCRAKEGDDVVKILDFGVAQESPRPDAPAPREKVAGSRRYMCPEQAMNGAVDERGDLYSFGVILHEMLVGKQPRGAGAPGALGLAISMDMPFAMRTPRPAEALEQLVRRCLQPRPEDRPRSADVVRDALERIQRGLGGTKATAAICDAPEPPRSRTMVKAVLS
jgi:eukaryotic-like serine/threonine-protein kinase